MQWLIPRSLQVTTDTVGLPTFSNFNIDYLYTSYALWVVLFPFLVFLFFKPSPETTSEPTGEAPKPSVRKEILENVFCTLGVGLPLGLTLGMFCVPLGVLIAALYALLVLYWAARNQSPTMLGETTSRVNSAVAVISFLGLAIVSAHTSVQTVSGTNSVPWLSPYVVVLITALVTAGLVRLSRNVPRAEMNFAIVSFAALPLLIFLLRVKLFQNLPEMDFFHEGEMTVPGAFLFEGWRPWKDIVAIHGMLHDVSIYALGRALFEDSRWGMHCAMLLLCYPAYWVSHYFLNLVLFRKQILVCLLSSVLLPFWLPRFFDHPLYRFLFFPIIFALFLSLLREGRWWRIFGFTLAIGIQAVLSPEASFLLPGFGIALILYEIPSRKFTRTIRVVVAGLTLVAILGGILHLGGLLDAFLEYYRNFSTDHRYARAIPFRRHELWFWVCAVTPPLALATFFIWMGMKWKRNGAIHERDCLFFALSVFLVLYYQKFLARTDGHVFEPWAMSLPLVFYLSEKVLNHKNRGLRYGMRALVAILMALLFVGGGGQITGPFDQAGSLGERLNVVAPRSTEWKRNGYAELSEGGQIRLRDFQALFDVYLEPADRIHDFTSQMGLFHYLLNRKPASRYFNQLFVHSERSQYKQIEDLRRHAPKLVIFHTPHSWTTFFDRVPSQVRHYRVAEYLWRNYEPLILLNDFLVLKNRRQKTLELPNFAGISSTRELYLEAGECNWGYAPTFFPPASTPAEETLAFRRVEKGLQIDFPRPNSEYSEIELTFSDLKDVRWVLDTHPVNEIGRIEQIAFRTRSAGRTTIRIPVAACAQWHRMHAQTLYLWPSAPMEVVQIRARRAAPGLLIAQSMSKFQ